LYQDTYWIDKSTGTFADNLAAFGLAFVIKQIIGDKGGVKIEDCGGAYKIACTQPISEDMIAQLHFFTGAPFLITFDNKTKTKVIKGTELKLSEIPLVDGENAVDYDVEKQRRQDYFSFRNGLSTEDKRQLAKGTIQPPSAPHKNWEIFRAINPGALQGYNGLMAQWWRCSDAFADVLRLLLSMTSTNPNNVDGAEVEWKKFCKAKGWPSKDATAAQLFNPAQGKGTNNAKAEWRDPANVKSFWLLEWLRAVGLFTGAITRIPKDSKDRKTYVLMPMHLDMSSHEQIMGEFRKAMAGTNTAIKLDILAALRYTKALLKHYEKARTEDLEQIEFGKAAGDLVAGMAMAFYKSLGNSPAVMNMAFINLPAWVKFTDASVLEKLDKALEEHLGIVMKLDETRGDQFAMLNNYRDFLAAREAGDLAPFFEFTTAYSGFIISQRERGNYAPQFTTTTLEVLFMNSDDSQRTFSQVLQNEGFKNVAYAIRHSTVVPQGLKARKLKPVVSIRYGLGQQLARKSAYPSDFMAEVADFLHLYNAENSQLRENKRTVYRKNVTTADIDALAGLVDKFGAKVVCNLLIAYGYAREPHQEEKQEEETLASDDEFEGDADAGNDEADE